MRAPDWFPDPLQRHELRYWDGNQWTEHVVTRGVQDRDPLPPVPAAPVFREITMDFEEPAPRRAKGWRLHIILGVVTLGAWLLAIPAVIAWRRGERGWTAGLAVAAVAGLVAIGNALPAAERTTVTAAAEESSSPSAAASASLSSSPAVSSQAPAAPSPTRSSTIAAFADGAATPKTRPVAPTPTSTPAAKATTTTKPTTKPKTSTSTATKKPTTSTTTKKPTTTAAAAKDFANCTDMRKVYPHGVGRPGAVDKTTGTPPVTNFTVSTALYAANSESDRDGDGIACEQL